MQLDMTGAAVGITLSIFATCQSLLVEVAKTGHGGKIPFHTPSAVLYCELLKGVVATAIWLKQRPTLGPAENSNPASRMKPCHPQPR